ncbi:peptidase family S58 [Calycina marina]|uniref:Peptidase family S58 n=1 Tax=Calycina marina TaxID=1763456 RepID=A0A9P7Z2X1_9HELO|nr:peptidase family S58 [Calycina marina]
MRHLLTLNNPATIAPPPTPRARVHDALPKLYLGSFPPDRRTECPSVNTIHPCYTGIFSFNGSGEMTGAHWLAETGPNSSIAIISSFAFLLSMVAETYDGYLNDIAAMPILPSDMVCGIENASAKRVPEGNTLDGTAMLCHDHKGGTRSASRAVEGLVTLGGGQEKKAYTLGVLVQANYGKPANLKMAAREPELVKDGSIVIIIATNAPLHPVYVTIVKRATVRLASVGGFGSNSSGDIFLAFSTANKVPRAAARTGRPPVAKKNIDVMRNTQLEAPFKAATMHFVWPTT